MRCAGASSDCGCMGAGRCSSSFEQLRRSFHGPLQIDERAGGQETIDFRRYRRLDGLQGAAWMFERVDRLDQTAILARHFRRDRLGLRA